jgi:hypothetical protein
VRTAQPIAQAGAFILQQDLDRRAGGSAGASALRRLQPIAAYATRHRRIAGVGDDQTTVSAVEGKYRKNSGSERGIAQVRLECKGRRGTAPARRHDARAAALPTIRGRRSGSGMQDCRGARIGSASLATCKEGQEQAEKEESERALP